MNTWNYAAGGHDWFIGAEWNVGGTGTALIRLSGCIENVNSIVSGMVRNVLAMDTVNQSRQDRAYSEVPPVVIDNWEIDLTGCTYIDNDALFILSKAALALTGAGGRAVLICTAESFVARKAERCGLDKHLNMRVVTSK